MFCVVAAVGQAFPLRTVEETVRILKIYNGSNDVEGIYGRRVIRQRFELEWIELAERGKVCLKDLSQLVSLS